MIEILIETMIRGVWTRYEPATEQFKGDPEDAAQAACKIVAGCLADNDWPGSSIRATWDEGGGPITLLENDPLLDDFIVDARENCRAWDESQRHMARVPE